MLILSQAALPGLDGVSLLPDLLSEPAGLSPLPDWGCELAPMGTWRDVLFFSSKGTTISKTPFWNVAATGLGTGAGEPLASRVGGPGVAGEVVGRADGEGAMP